MSTQAQKKATLPTDDAAFKALDTRLGQEMARCARDYDDARTHLKAHHAKMGTQEAALVKQIAALQPSVDGLLDGTGPGLTKAVAQDCLKYMELNAQLHKTRQAQRLSYGGTVPAGQQRLGGALGDPSPNSAAQDLGEFSQKGLVSDFGNSAYLGNSLRGVKVALLFKAVGLKLHGPAPDPIPPASVTPPSENPHFRQWFAGSKVTSDSGEPQQTHTSSAAFAAPKVVYHGTSSRFRAFDAKRNAKDSLYGPGHYFTENHGVAASYLDHVKGTSASLEVVGQKLNALREKASRVRGQHSYKYNDRFPQPDQIHHITSTIRNLDGTSEMQTHYHGDDLLKAQQAFKKAIKNKPLSTKFSSYSPHEKEDYNRSLGDVQDATKAHEAANKAYLKKQEAISPKVHSLYLNIKKPFDVHNPAHAKEVAKFHGVKLGDTVTHGGHYDGYYHLRSSTGGSKEYDGNDNTHTYDMIKKAGFDGITHIGGIHTNSPVKHRVWIAMHDNQVKHVDNKGTFDPKTRDMYKSVRTDINKAIDGGNWNRGEPSYLTDKPGKTLVPKRPLFAEGLPRAAATALGNSLKGVKVALLFKSINKTMYHGTNAEFTHFAPVKGMRYNSLGGQEEVQSHGTFLAHSPETAAEFGNHVMAVPVKLSKPLVKKDDLYSHIPAKRMEHIKHCLSPLIQESKGTDSDGKPYHQKYIEAGVWRHTISDDHGNEEHEWPRKLMGENGLDWGTVDHPEVAKRMVHLGYDHAHIDEPDEADGSSVFVPHPHHLVGKPHIIKALTPGSVPRFQVPKIAFKPRSPLGRTPKAPAMKTPASPVNRLDSGSLADSIGGHLHDVQSRMTKPVFGKPQEQHAHLMSHALPKKAAEALHAHLASQGKVGAITEQRVSHADGGMAHLYSFEHTDHTGAKHIIHMMRSAQTTTPLKPKNGAAPLPHLRNATPSAAPKAPRAPRQARSRAAATSASPPSGKAFDPGMAMTHEAFTPAFLAHHAKQGTLPEGGAAKEKMLNAGWKAHQTQYPHP